jgi:hypothetical protein
MLSRAQSRNLVGLLVSLLAVTVGCAVVAVPFSTPMPGFWDSAREFAATGHISNVFAPCGYPGLLGLGVRFGGVGGAVALQLLIYLLILVAVYMTLLLLDANRMIAAAGACLLGLHPDLVVSIKKVWDTNITTALLVLICASLLAVLRRGLTPTRAIVIGIIWGLSINVRPNFPALVLPIAFAFWFAPVRANRTRLLFASGMLTLAGASLAVIVVSILVHGSFYIPENGPYNFYAGNNAFTERALLTSLNAEPSIYPSLLAEDFSTNVNIYNPDLRPYYMKQALLQARDKPLETIKLVLLKLVTLLRPDTKIYPLSSLGGMVQAALALAIPIWLVALTASRGEAWGLSDSLFLLFVVSYVTPYLVTNSDPRFRIPLDVLLLTHAISRIGKLWIRWQLTT